MRIGRAAWAGFRGLGDGAIDLSTPSGEPAGLAIVTGPPGSGKTRTLEMLIAGKEQIGAYGPKPPSRAVVEQGSSAAKIVIDWWLSDDERSFAGVRTAEQRTESIYAERGVPEVAADPAIGALLERYDHNPRHGKVDYIPADRGLPSYGSAVGDPVFDQRSKRLARGPDKYAGLARMANDLVMRRHDPGRLAELERLLKALCPHLSIGAVNGAGELEMVRTNGRACSVLELSHSERQAFAIATDLVLCGIRGSVVLFDTPELYLSGAEAARWLSALREHAPDNQWIVATVAPEVIELGDVTRNLATRGG